MPSLFESCTRKTRQTLGKRPETESDQGLTPNSPQLCASTLGRNTPHYTDSRVAPCRHRASTAPENPREGNSSQALPYSYISGTNERRSEPKSNSSSSPRTLPSRFVTIARAAPLPRPKDKADIRTGPGTSRSAPGRVEGQNGQRAAGKGRQVCVGGD